MEKQKYPEVRFSQFHKSWEVQPLKNIFGKIRNAFVGTATPFYVKKGNFYLESNNVKDGKINKKSQIFIDDYFYLKQRDKWLKTDDLVMVQSGHVGHSAVISEDLNNSAAHALIMFSDYKVQTNPHFLNYQWQTNSAKNAIEKIATGNTIRHILSSDMKEFLSFFSSYDEQSQIGNFFQNLDQSIASHEKKLAQTQNLKKAMLEKMFPKAGNTQPEIRLKGFSGDWELYRLGDIASPVDRKDSESTAPVMMISAASGFINQSEKYSSNNAGQSLAKYILLQKGELAYNHGASKHKPYGACFALKVEEARIPFVYHCFNVRNNNPYFIAIVLNHFRIDEQLRKLISSGARMDGLLNISFDAYKTIEIMLPQKEEQNKIYNFFASLDEVITLHQQQLQTLKNLKQALLEKMFV